MSRYRTWELQAWGDEKFRALSKPQPNAQTVFQWFVIGPETTSIPGVIPCHPFTCALYYGWLSESLQKGFWEAIDEAIAIGLLKTDRESLTWLPNATKPTRKSNKPQSPNVVTSWGKLWPQVPEGELKSEIWQHLRAYTEALGKSYLKAFVESCPKPSAKTSPNQEQEQEQEKNTHVATPRATDRASTKTSKATRELPREAYEIAEYLRAKILGGQPDHRLGLPTYWTLSLKASWAETIDLMMRRDKRTAVAAKALIDWVFGDQGGCDARFVVESPRAMREKWDAISRAAKDARAHKAKSEPYAPERTIINPGGDQ